VLAAVNYRYVLPYTRATTHSQTFTKKTIHVKQCKMLNDNESEGVPRCCYKLDPAYLSNDILLLA